MNYHDDEASAAFEAATGMRLDARVQWTEPVLRELGCPPALAARIVGPGSEAATAPAIDFASTAIPGLSPIGDGVAGPDEFGPVPRGWRRWGRGARA